MTVRPRRSVLYMPGSNPRALEKARTLKADALILDLEDAVAPDAKDTARANVLATLAQGGYGGRELLVRTNGLATPWGEADLIAAARSGADGVLLPKVESARMVTEALAILAAHGAPERLAIWCMMETPRGILAAAEIGAASPRLAGLVMGTSDLAKDLHCAHTRDRLPLIASLNQVVLVARAHGLAAIDGVHLDLADDEGFAFACRQGRELGFDGKTLIHPKTIDEANRAFAPSADEIAQAQTIIAAFAQAQAKGQGVVVVEGKLVESLHVENAKRMVALAQAIDALA
ncbi:MAG: CoA ester lyase [Rhodospirillales bacterium]|nr:CoA ester lyase [Rhodospirillales bacterium]